MPYWLMLATNDGPSFGIQIHLDFKRVEGQLFGSKRDGFFTLKQLNAAAETIVPIVAQYVAHVESGNDARRAPGHG